MYGIRKLKVSPGFMVSGIQKCKEINSMSAGSWSLVIVRISSKTGLSRQKTLANKKSHWINTAAVKCIFLVGTIALPRGSLLYPWESCKLRPNRQRLSNHLRSLWSHHNQSCAMQPSAASTSIFFVITLHFQDIYFQNPLTIRLNNYMWANS